MSTVQVASNPEGTYWTRTTWAHEASITEVVARELNGTAWYYRRYVSARGGDPDYPVHGGGSLPLTSDHVAITLAIWDTERADQT